MIKVIVTYLDMDGDDSYADIEEFEIIPRQGEVIFHADGTWWTVKTVVHIVRQLHGGIQHGPSVAVTAEQTESHLEAILTKEGTRDG
jgi:hypothetical protein